MRRLVALAVLLAACGGSQNAGVTNPPPNPGVKDPAISIHLVDQLDTTTTMGRASWVVYPLLYSADAGKTGMGYNGAITLGDRRLDHSSKCIAFQADSLGARFVVILAVADTLHGTQSDAAAQTVANAWFGGNHTLPSGWAALASDSLDWGVSTQFSQGHGLTTSDPVKWSMTWTSPARVARSESPTDTSCGA